jgi:hypothetical protein
MAQRHAASGAGADVAEDFPDRHTDGLDRGVAIAALRDMPAQRLGVPVLDNAEQPDLAILDGDDLGRIGRPHQVRRLGDDLPVVRRVVTRASAMRR